MKVLFKEGDHFMVDYPKMRLLSPEMKSMKGDDDTNPAIGKSF